MRSRPSAAEADPAPQQVGTEASGSVGSAEDEPNGAAAADVEVCSSGPEGIGEGSDAAAQCSRPLVVAGGATMRFDTGVMGGCSGVEASSGVETCTCCSVAADTGGDGSGGAVGNSKWEVGPEDRDVTVGVRAM
eukprot:TRINITY_DN76361_c0_g1_i1.p1 TRINITY_DN76361_c0_g1~~TRINITY_DN76361_c0_g1_i1.p1  ORF type:complete len:134 (+),score=41.14 TRINITY_DN76361_c0_g1_i1:222-623(+)